MNLLKYLKRGSFSTEMNLTQLLLSTKQMKIIFSIRFALVSFSHFPYCKSICIGQSVIITHRTAQSESHRVLNLITY